MARQLHLIHAGHHEIPLRVPRKLHVRRIQCFPHEEADLLPLRQRTLTCILSLLFHCFKSRFTWSVFFLRFFHSRLKNLPSVGSKIAVRTRLSLLSFLLHFCVNRLCCIALLWYVLPLCSCLLLLALATVVQTEINTTNNRVHVR